MVFVLYDLPPGELRDAAAFLALSAVWKKIQDTDTIPDLEEEGDSGRRGMVAGRDQPEDGKALLPSGRRVRPRDSEDRKALQRRRSSSRPSSSPTSWGGEAYYGPGRIIIESCSTKIVLKQDQAASQVLKEAFNLSDGEEKFIVNAKIGQGILVTQEGRIPFYNFLSDEERRLFTTKPKEVTA